VRTEVLENPQKAHCLVSLVVKGFGRVNQGLFYFKHFTRISTANRNNSCKFVFVFALRLTPLPVCRERSNVLFVCHLFFDFNMIRCFLCP
jgi:hypothetical protein